jgi:ABC-type nickel/cobalt efflux system permease component RcnA
MKAIPQLIRERGFRRWYESELMRGHSQLVLLLLCALAVMGALEAFSSGHGADRLLMVASLLIAAGIGAWSLRRYLFHLMRAELIANQAVCPQCKVYARWAVETHHEAAVDQPEDASTMNVCCRACEHRWTIGW